jgi:hypothetical protein
LQGEVELGSGAARLTPSLIWVKAVGIEDGNCEKVTTRMNPSVIVWDLETVPDLGGFAAVNDLVGKSNVEEVHRRLALFDPRQRVTTRATLAVWRRLISAKRSDIRCLILKAKMT